MNAPRRSRAGWRELLLTSGLAALISGALSYLGIAATQARERATQQCQIAAAILQDDTLSPYINDRERQRMTALAARTLQRCLEQP